jgi:hypothetical protein
MGSGSTAPINSCYHLALNILFFCLLLYLKTQALKYINFHLSLWEEGILSSVYVEDDHWL